MNIVLDHLGDPPVAAALLIRFELALLKELGFGLDLVECASTGSRDGLVYVSPKSGRAVSEAAGAPWQNRLLPLPAFLAPHRSIGVPSSGIAAFPPPADIVDGFRLTGYFLDRHVFTPRGLPIPEARARFITAAVSNSVSRPV